MWLVVASIEARGTTSLKKSGQLPACLFLQCAFPETFSGQRGEDTTLRVCGSGRSEPCRWRGRADFAKFDSYPLESRAPQAVLGIVGVLGSFVGSLAALAVAIR